MSIIDTIIQACSGRPWWENVLKLALSLWLTFVNIVAVEALKIALNDRRTFQPDNTFVYLLGMAIIVTYALLTVLCVLADFFFLMQLF